jgi:hypothetical protein
MIVFAYGQLKHVPEDGSASFLPGWNKPESKAVLEPGGLDPFLARTRPGYQMYRFIDDHRLRMVLQPYDLSPGLFRSAGYEGHDADDFVPWWQIPDQRADLDDFPRSNDIRYFIYRPARPKPEAATLDSIRPHQAEWADALLQSLLPRSHPIFADALGGELRAIDGAGTP